MAKKSFRPQHSGLPGYPILRDVDRATVRRWGLVGLLLGGAACTPARAELPPPGEPPLQRVESKPATKPDASPNADEPDTTVVRMGKPTAPRPDEPKQKPAKAKKADKAKTPHKKGDAKAKADAAKGARGKDQQAASAEPPSLPTQTLGMRGKVRMPRVDEKEKLSP